MSSIIQQSAALMSRLDAAGHAIVIMRCSHDSDIRRIIGEYAHKKAAAPRFTTKDTPKNTADTPIAAASATNLFEATPLGTYHRFDHAFSWGEHGLSDDDTLKQNNDAALMQFLQNCCMTPACKQHNLMYIPSFKKLLDSVSAQIGMQYLSLLSAIARHKQEGKCNTLIVIGCTDGSIHDDLKNISYIMDIPYPDTKEIAEIIESACRSCNAGKLSLTRAQINRLAEGMRGLRENEIRMIFNMAFATHEDPTQNDAAAIHDAAIDAKKQLINGVTGLYWIDVEGKVGGLHNLVIWLEQQRYTFRHPHLAKIQNAKPPKGVLLWGLPGSGKTTIARYTATLLGSIDAPLPLLQMKLSDFNSKYVGESETKFNIALRTIESVAPAVLLVDEIEKALGSVADGSAHEVTVNLFNYLLDWLQKKKEKPIFVIATANRTEKLPPELIRKGRLDETFFVGVPSREECHEIFKVHLNKNSTVMQKHDDNTLTKIIDAVMREAAQRKRFLNGADIEYLVNESFNSLFSKQIQALEASPELLAEYNELDTPFRLYSPDELKEEIISVLRSTRSYFDNNMEGTARYLAQNHANKDMKEAGGPLRDENDKIVSYDRVVLPTGEDIFNPETMTYAPGKLAEMGLLNAPNDLPKNDDDYLPWTERQLQAAVAQKDYNGVFRWRLANEIRRLK